MKRKRQEQLAEDGTAETTAGENARMDAGSAGWFAVVAVPDFALQALRRSDPGLAGRPLGLIAGEGRKAVLTAVSAEAVGAERGLTVTLAMARCPGIVLRGREVKAEAEARRLLVAAAFTLSPRVEVTDEESCTVDLQGADQARTEGALERAVAELARMGLPARGGIGPTPLLAAYAARGAAPVAVAREREMFLRDLPVGWAEPTAEQAEVLAGWGIRTMGQLGALPKAQVAARLGAAGVALWERATGEATRPLKLTVPARTYVAQWEYEPGIENLEPLLFKLRRFAECLALELRGAGFVAEALTLTLMLEDETDYPREFRVAEPGTEVEGWLRVVLAHLESVRLAARVVAVRLGATPTRPLVKQDGLFDTGLRDAQAFWENLARVEAILGAGRVGTPVVANTWRPDAVGLERPAESVPAAEAAPAQPMRGGLLRRYRPARMVRVALAAGRPAELEGAVTGKVRAAQGPWRSDGGWWEPDGWAVENWRVELDDGAVYQIGHYAEGWRVEGGVE